jgi:organic radical activating enzyme
VNAGPKRKEIMTHETIDRVLDWLSRTEIPVVDLTGGAPEMNPNFRWLVGEAHALGRRVIDRCNLTILLLPGFDDLPEFLAEHQVEIVASLPCYLAENTDAQRDTLLEVCRQVKKGAMPLSSYTLLHREAVLSAADVATLCTWSEQARAALR